MSIRNKIARANTAGLGFRFTFVPDDQFPRRSLCCC